MELTRGKSAWALFACAQAICPLLRSMGHRVPCVSHYVWDRGCDSSLDELVRQWHLREASQSTSPTAEVEALTDFVVTNADVLHDIGHVFHWGLTPYLSVDLKDLSVGIPAVRNAYDLLMQHLSAWLATVVVFTSEPQSADFLELLWSSLGVDDDVALAGCTGRVGSCRSVRAIETMTRSCQNWQQFWWGLGDS